MGTLGKIKSTGASVSAALLLCLALCPAAYASTAPGSTVSNIATFEYPGSQPLDSNTEAFEVQELTGLNLLDLNTAPVGVATPSQQLLQFRLEHLGNGLQAYSLELTQSASDDFDVASLELWLDSDGDGVFDETEDTLYDPANLPELAAGESLDLFVRLLVPAG
jgi:hypothetical protein